jgi:hypothetical protein
MTSSPDEIRANIEATRQDLGSNVDALADKVTPSKIVGRQTDKVKGAFSSARERVMGSVSDSKAGAAGTASDVRDSVTSTVKGNPLAVGLIVFGAAWLASSLIPASDMEKQVGSRVKEAAAPAIEDLKESAKDVAQNLKEPATEAANAVKETAKAGAGNVKDEATSAASEIKDRASEAKDAVQGA